MSSPSQPEAKASLEPFELSAAQQDRLEKLLASMSLADKIGQLAQFDGGGKDMNGEIAAGRVGSIMNFSGAGLINAVHHAAREAGRIPVLAGLDVIHGFVTTFPIPIAEACSFDLGLAERTAEAAAIEASAAGLRWTFAPMVDVGRDARWGRVMEGAGEDPVLGAAFAAARVRGFQRKRRMAACLKHFVAYGAAEAGRDYTGADVNPRKLWGVYYPPFQAGLLAGAATLMSSFNTVNDVPLASDPEGLRDVLKDRFGFKGVVVSDWLSVDELTKHGVAEGPADTARQGLLAGVDMDMTAGHYLNHLEGLVRDGQVPEACVTDAARRILRVKMWLGLLDDPMTDETLAAKVTLSRSHRELALEAAQKSCVLLKNEGVLPLKEGIRRVALLGPLADDRDQLLGGWSAHGDAKHVVSLLQGLKNRLGTGVEIAYAPGCAIEGGDRSGFQKALDAAAASEAVVMALGESRAMSGENASRTDLGLPGAQRELLEKVLELGKPVVLVLFNGRPLALQWEHDHVPAILEAWFPGVEGGNAVADLLLGRADPQGRLVSSFPRVVGQVPIYHAVLPTGRPPRPDQPWASRYIDCPVTPLYPFGHGLTYTSFTYSEPSAPATVGILKPFEVRVLVSNTGPRAGTETAQLYVRDLVACVSRPVREFKAFQKVRLQPGESRELIFTVEPRDLAYFDRSLRFGLDPGRFEIFVGANAADAQKAGVEIVGESKFHELPGQRPALAQEQRSWSAPFAVGGGGSAADGLAGPTGPTGPTGPGIR